MLQHSFVCALPSQYSRLEAHFPFAVENDDDLQLSKITQARRRLGNATAAHQVLKRVERSDHPDAIPEGLEILDDLFSASTFISQRKGVIEQHGERIGSR